MLQADNITHKYGTEEVLHNVSFSLQQDSFVAIIGESGSGKTTLLSILSTLLKPTSGVVRIIGEDVNKIKDINIFRNTNIGFVFQFHYLINYLNVTQNITLAMNHKDRAYLNSLLKDLGIEDIKNRYPYEISGGQRQRVAIARALINKPKIIFADEPTGNLDSKNSKNVFELFKNITQTQKVSVVVATHDLQNAQSADTIYEMQDGHISNYN